MPAIAQDAPPVSASLGSNDVVDASTLTGKVMVGYQGWFNCEGDGADLGWKHWTRRRGLPSPTNITVDLWPDLSEMDADERYATEFKNQDGNPAEVFSSYNRKTVLRHFGWMKDYGIDGAFVQRFANQLQNRRLKHHVDVVLSHVREGAKQSGRTYAVMYDLSGLGAGDVKRVAEDWKRLQTEENISADAGYLHHEGKPLVSIWGIGFSDNRPYSPQECLQLVEELKSAGCAVMLGVPSYWRDGTRDAIGDPILHQIIKLADVVSPWTIGRYQSPRQAERHAEQVWRLDREWLEAEGIDFLPVAFPGFSWRNLHGGQLNQIPRLKGDFYWSQITAAKDVGCKMLYVAMFDEVDEATAIFKCTNDPPVTEESQFITYEGLPSDHYLKLTGQAAELFRDAK
ncbi:glycoside hydrolase family 71/99-like protein [Stieleria sp. JC731]|uniref:glycoside hydrolase family 71/99-like protein n=1 Tax=Pirellulaceae TaxID=2691357 RepID=UPI001E592D06|nr:glycoside hydrolase family 71/99-like protein [Stieleria sp. JC731]MCC9602513.1 glycoside hydrolase family 71/99-like protein [Stieleria sp. JC731]